MDYSPASCGWGASALRLVRALPRAKSVPHYLVQWKPSTRRKVVSRMLDDPLPEETQDRSEEDGLGRDELTPDLPV